MGFMNFFDKYEWTEHSQVKMRQYGLSEQRIIRVIRVPFRYEEGVLDGAVGVMQPTSVKKIIAGKPVEWKQEIWVMYVLAKPRNKKRNLKITNFALENSKVIKIITAWRYPGMSPKRDPIPSEIMEEVRRLI